MLVDPMRFLGLILFMFALGMACGFWIGRIHERDKRRAAMSASKGGA